jgi:hypothetical protein
VKRLEIIHLRLAGNTPASLINDIRRSVFTGNEKDKVRLYFNATLQTDLSFHIHLKNNVSIVHRSDLGVRLAAALREYGMVQHTMWIEDQGKTK